MKSLKTLVLAAFLFTGINASAQMTESQIIDYIQTKTEAGVSEKQIAMDLVSKGVSVEKLQQLKEKYSRSEAFTSSRKENGTGSQNGLRVLNGETEPQTDVNRNEGTDLEGDRTGSRTTAKQIFGHDIFRSENLSFTPNMNAPTPADYVLGPGDELVINIFGSSNISSTCVVSPDGAIEIPDEGILYVSGLSCKKAQEYVSQMIGAHYEDSQVRVAVGQTRTIIVHVLGEVVTPGSYTVSAFTNVFNVLYLSGGVTEYGTLRDIQVMRDGKVISNVDIYDFIKNGKLDGKLTLQDDDVIKVGTYDRLVKIEGNVKRPMYYEMKKGEHLSDLLDYAGGFTGDAFKDNIRIERRSNDGITVHNVRESEFHSFENEDCDVVWVAPIVDRMKQTVKVSGAVFRPGKYKIDENMNTVSALVELAGGLDEKAITELAVILRLKDNRTYESVPVALGDILNGAAPDITLKNEDELIISSTSERDELRSLDIEGEVFNPGKYPYSENETVATLITRAGGLKESAYLLEIEVARRIVREEDDPDGTSMAIIKTVSLENGLTAEASDMKLEPFDIVTVMKSPHYKEQQTVMITGEVIKEGTYVLSNTGEHLSDLIKRAGGLKSDAFVGGAQITRMYSPEKIEQLERDLETAASADDSIKILREIEDNTYSVGVNLQDALDKPGSSSDLVITMNDVITIPRLNNTVSIRGEVLSPNTVSYINGKNLKYYLNQAGGINKKTGRKNQTYIIYANGTKSKASKGKVLPGCDVVVPKYEKVQINPQNASVWLGMGSTAASIAAVIYSIFLR